MRHRCRSVGAVLALLAAAGRSEPLRLLDEDRDRLEPAWAARLSATSMLAGTAVGIGLVLAAGDQHDPISQRIDGNIAMVAGGLALLGASLVVGPSLGRLAGGDLERPKWFVGARLLLGGAIAGCSLLAIEPPNGSSGIGIAAGVALIPLVLALLSDGTVDVATTRSDLALDRALRAAQGLP